MGERPEFLTTAQAERSEYRLAITVVLISTLIFLLAVPFARVPLPQVWAFIPIYESALAINELITSVLLIAHARMLRSRPLLVLGCGYLFTAGIVIPHALTFPGLFTEGGLLGATSQSTAWLYMFWHAGLPVAVIAYAQLEVGRIVPVGPHEPAGVPILLGVLIVIAAVVACTLLATAGHALLPPIMRGNGYSPAMIVVVGATWALSVVALFALWFRPHHTKLDLWLMVVMCIWIFDIGLSAVLNGARFDLGFYAGRAYGLLATVFVLLLLLFETAALYGRLAWLLEAEQQELKSESELRRRIFETSLDLILVTDRRGRILKASPSCEAILGYSTEEMRKRSGREFIYREDIDSTRREVRLARRRGQMRNFECRYVHRDGHVVPLTWTGVWSEPEEQHYFIGRDMTEHKLEEEKFHLAVEACPSGMLMIDSARRIAMVNTEVERMFGYQRDVLIGAMIDLVVPDGRYLAVPEGANGRDCKLMGRRKDGTEFPVEVALTQVRTRQEPLLLCVVIDVTERRRAERLKDEFVATVSHELRTPLTSIAGSLSLLVDGLASGASDSAMRLLTIAHSNCQRLVRLVNDILDIEKLEFGNLEFDLRRVDVKPLVAHAIEANSAFSDSFRVRVRLDASAEDAVARADPDRLTQVVINLLSNAVKFSPASQDVVVSIATRADRVLISVRDRGPGIPDDFKSRVFEKFAQADATDARRRGGTGLGLSITKQIVQALSGNISFCTDSGGGTVFTVEIPSWNSQTMLDSGQEHQQLSV